MASSFAVRKRISKPSSRIRYPDSSNTSKIPHPPGHPVKSRTFQTYYVSQKLSQARWRPESMNSYTNHFVTGSWDQGLDNTIKLWHLKRTKNDLAMNTGPPECLSTHYVTSGDVTQIKFVDGSSFIYTTSDGSINLMKILEEGNSCKLQLVENQSWDLPTRMGGGAACTSVDFRNDILLTGTDDGYISCFSLTQSSPIATFDDIDLGAINTVHFLRQKECISGNILGQFKVWDLRTPVAPANIFCYNKSRNVGISSSAVFPSQPHILVAGGSDASMSAWDLRSTSLPLSQFKAHSRKVTEIQYHPTRPTLMFTSSENGEVWLWRGLQNKFNGVTSEENIVFCQDSAISASLDGTKPRVAILVKKKSLASNSVDASRCSVLTSSDNECFILHRQLFSI